MSNPERPITEVDRLLMLASEAQRAQDFDAATQLCERAHQAAPRDPAPLAARGYLVLNQGDLYGFQKWLAQALELTPWGGRASLLADSANELAGQAMTGQNPHEYLAAAVEYLTAAIGYAPRNAAAAMLVRRGNLQLTIGRPEDAWNSYNSVLDCLAAEVPVPDTVIMAAYTGLTRCLMAVEEYAAAVEVAREARDRFPEDPSTWRSLGYTLQVGEWYNEAVTAYEGALSKGAQAPDVLVDIATCHYNRCDKAAARTCLVGVVGTQMPPLVAQRVESLLALLGHGEIAFGVGGGYRQSVRQWRNVIVPPVRRTSISQGHTDQSIASLN